MGGERTPHNDAQVRGVFAGLGHESDRAALARAVVEGVAFALCDSRDASRAAGTQIARLAAVGGGTRSRYWLEVLATALDVPVDVPMAGDFGAAFGAARLGLIAATGAPPADVLRRAASRRDDRAERGAHRGLRRGARALPRAVSRGPRRRMRHALLRLRVPNGVYSPNASSAVHTFCHALPQTWHQMGVILLATDSLNWLAELTGQAPAALTASLGERLEPPGRATFLPYLGGERTPHNDAAVRGAFAGLGHETDRRALTRAVLEGIAFALCDSRDALCAAGTDIARLGSIAATGASPAEVCVARPVAETIELTAALVESYAAAHERYRALYPAIRGVL